MSSNSARRAIVCVLLVAGCTGKGDQPQPPQPPQPEEKQVDERARSAEADLNLPKIVAAARAYYMEEMVARGSLTPLDKQFPTSTAVAPPLGTCCQAGGKCPPNPSLWNDPSWQALKFSMDDPHHYSYAFTSQGTDAGATFKAAAYGDLDCDGVYSTFEMEGSADAEGNVRSGGMFKNQELE